MKFTRLIFPAIVALLLNSCGKEQKPTLETVKAETGNLSETVTATGTVESVTQVDVGTQVTGIIDKLYADYNTIVRKGHLVAELDKTILQSDLASAEANVESNRLTYEYNLANYKRDKALHDKQLISDYEFQTSKKDYEVSKLAYDKSRADRVRAARNLSYAEIYSPIDGIVISREVEVGQTVVSSMNVANLFVIADLDNMQVIGNVDEADIGQVKVGQKVTFSVDAYPDEVFEGSVTQVRLNPTTSSNVVTYEVVVDAPNPDHKLIPGLTANLTIYTLEQNDILLLPVSAFNFKPQQEVAKTPELAADQKCVWVKKGEHLRPVAVTVGVSNGVMTEIKSGLKAGEDVAVGYTSMAAKTEAQGERSPFAPGPPGANKKK